MTGKPKNMIENRICTVDYAAELPLNSDNLQPKISVNGVLGRPGG